MTTLITGASGGIGLALAREMATHGHDLILVARSEQKLHEIADELRRTFNVESHVYVSDLTRPEAPAELLAATDADGHEVEILVNNAGFATHGAFVDLPLERELAMIQLNVTTLTALTHLYLQGMVERGAGRILNVASTAAFQPGPMMAVYYATKSYVLSFSEALANELRGSGVSVTALCPGPTASGFQARADMEGARLLQAGLMSAEAVAGAGYEAMMAGKPMVIPGLRDRLIAFAPRLMPRRLTTALIRQANERPGGEA